MNLVRAVESIPSPAAHAVGVTSGATGLALWADVASHLSVIVGLAAAFAALFGALCYGAYWALKFWAKLARVRKGDYSE